MKTTSWYIIFLIVGLLVTWSYFRIQSQDQQEQTQETLLRNMSHSIDILTKISEHQQEGQQRGTLILEEQERQRQQANITTKDFVDRFNQLVNITLQKEEQKQLANITTVEFVEEFRELINETRVIFNILRSGLPGQTEIIEGQEKIIALLENLTIRN